MKKLSPKNFSNLPKVMQGAANQSSQMIPTGSSFKVRLWLRRWPVRLGPLAQAPLPGCETQALNGLLGALCLSAPDPPAPSQASLLPQTTPASQPSICLLPQPHVPPSVVRKAQEGGFRGWGLAQRCSRLLHSPLSAAPPRLPY